MEMLCTEGCILQNFLQDLIYEKMYAIVRSHGRVGFHSLLISISWHTYRLWMYPSCVLSQHLICFLDIHQILFCRGSLVFDPIDHWGSLEGPRNNNNKYTLKRLQRRSLLQYKQQGHKKYTILGIALAIYCQPRWNLQCSLLCKFNYNVLLHSRNIVKMYANQQIIEELCVAIVSELITIRLKNKLY